VTVGIAPLGASQLSALGRRDRQHEARRASTAQCRPAIMIFSTNDHTKSRQTNVYRDAAECSSSIMMESDVLTVNQLIKPVSAD